MHYVKQVLWVHIYVHGGLFCCPNCLCMGSALYVITINYHYHMTLHQPLHSKKNKADVDLPHIILMHTMVNNVCHHGKQCVDHVM